MKKLATIIAMLILVLCYLSACGKGTYEDGYADGYSDAEAKMEYLMEDEFFDSYDNGYDDGYFEGSREGWIDHLEKPGRYLEEEAVHYARQYSEWHPEEALAIIYSYQNGEPLYDDGVLPSHEEYLEAIESLCRFYEYFYCAIYE